MDRPTEGGGQAPLRWSDWFNSVSCLQMIRLRSALACLVAFTAGCEREEAASNVAVARHRLIPPGNLTSNPSFETDTNGWGASPQTTLTRVVTASAPDGNAVARISANNNRPYISLDDSPYTLSGIVAGRALRARAQLAAVPGGAVGKSGELSIREVTPTYAFVADASQTLPLSTAFTQFTIDHTTTAAGNLIEIYVALINPSTGDAMDIDEITLVDLPEPPTPPEGASQLRVTGIGSPLVVGQLADVTVEALDDAGNVAHSYEGTVTFQSTDPTATLPSPTAFTTAHTGAQTFLGGVRFGAGGVHSVTVSDGALSGAQTNILVNDSAPPPAWSVPLERAQCGRPFRAITMTHLSGTTSALADWRLEAAPDGLEVDSSTGELHWLPTRSQVGTHQVMLISQTPAGLASWSVELEVECPEATFLQVGCAAGGSRGGPPGLLIAAVIARAASRRSPASYVPARARAALRALRLPRGRSHS